MGYRVFDHTFFFFKYCQHQLSTYIHIKNIYLYIVVPVNCGRGKYISFHSKKKKKKLALLNN